MLRAEEAQARFEYIRSRAAEVSEQDKIKREELARKLEVSKDSSHGTRAAECERCLALCHHACMLNKKMLGQPRYKGVC